MAKSIAADADAQIQAILEQARATATAESGKAAAEASATRAEILAKADEKIAKLKAREQALARAEARRIELSARETAIAAVLDRIQEEMSALRADSETYRRSLQTLAVEAIQGIAAPQVRLRFAPADQPLVNDTFLDGVNAGIQARTGHNCAVQVSFDLEDTGGGCVAESVSGHIIFDNTFVRRMEQARSSLRTAIVREAAKYHG
ncbi:MAG: hypothetical protein IT364_26170 [Candidatus Hydrogenedentes bacterium]|nr:hypothetical protein [Candidatus Hydrogenedentota bacterium]